jgi:hypothetical protein
VLSGCRVLDGIPTSLGTPRRITRAKSSTTSVTVRAGVVCRSLELLMESLFSLPQPVARDVYRQCNPMELVCGDEMRRVFMLALLGFALLGSRAAHSSKTAPRRS